MAQHVREKVYRDLLGFEDAIHVDSWIVYMDMSAW